MYNFIDNYSSWDSHYCTEEANGEGVWGGGEEKARFSTETVLQCIEYRLFVMGIKA